MVDPRVLYETPVRVFAPLGDNGLALCDYIFIDEDVSNSVERFQDLAELEVSEEDIDTSAERTPGKAFFYAK